MRKSAPGAHERLAERTFLYDPLFTEHDPGQRHALDPLGALRVALTWVVLGE